MFCESSGALVPKDKAVKRFIVRNIVESAALRDLQESCVYDCKCPGPPRHELRGGARQRHGADLGAQHASAPPLARLATRC